MIRLVLLVFLLANCAHRLTPQQVCSQRYDFNSDKWFNCVQLEQIKEGQRKIQTQQIINDHNRRMDNIIYSK